MPERSMLSSLNQILVELHWSVIAAGAIVIAMVVGALDYAVGRDVSLGALYVLPVGGAAWYAGRDVGFSVALVASIFSFLAFEGGVGIDDPLAYGSNWFLLTLLYLLVADLVHRVQARLLLESQLARIDALTGSLNKRAFEEELDYHLALAAREKLPLSLAYIDVDDFKEINDRYGHPGGDRVLQSIAAALKAFTRRTDRVTRIGGDEFAILLPDTNAEGAERIIRVSRRAFAEAFSPGMPLITCSIGVVTFVGPQPTASEAIAMADELMYQVKRAGKGQIRFRTHAVEATVNPDPASEG